MKCVETLAARERFDCWNVPDRDGDTPITKAVKSVLSSTFPNTPSKIADYAQKKLLCKTLLKCPRVDANLSSLIKMARNSGILLSGEIVELLEECDRSRNPKKNKKKKKKTKTDNQSTQDNDDEAQISTSEVKGKMSRIQEVIEANEELKAKIKGKEGEIQQLRTSSDKDAEDLSKDLQKFETEIVKQCALKKKAEEEIQRLQGVIKNCNLNISSMRGLQETKKDQAQGRQSNHKAAEDVLKSEIKELKNNFESNLKTVDVLMRKGIEAEEEEEKEEEKESTANQKLISFLTKSIEEKEEAIKVKQSDLECPVCLETAEGEIYCCIQQHLVCSQCRPSLVTCPQCKPKPLCLDAKVTHRVSGIIREQGYQMSSNIINYNVEEYTAKILRKLDVQPGTEMRSRTLVKFGVILSIKFGKSPALTFLYGAVPSKPAESEKKKPARAREPKTALKETCTLDINQNRNNPGQLDGTEKMVEKAMGCLVRQFKKSGRQPVDYFQFILDLERFSKTIENMFHVSFLVNILLPAFPTLFFHFQYHISR